MAYYDAFIAKWATLTPGTTVAKLTQINAAMANGSAIPMIIPTYRIYNLIDTTEFGALNATNQQLVRDILGMGTVDSSPGTSIRARMIAVFTNASGATRVALAALAATYDTPQILWWKANGYARAFDMGDVTAAGLS